jgi:hypothetical protein
MKYIIVILLLISTNCNASDTCINLRMVELPMMQVRMCQSSGVWKFEYFKDVWSEIGGDFFIVSNNKSYDFVIKQLINKGLKKPEILN